MVEASRQRLDYVRVADDMAVPALTRLECLL